jgi:sugar phosphate isomerase/epimerase
MSKLYNRRNILQNLAVLAPAAFTGRLANAGATVSGSKPGKLKISLNAYSFNKPLMDGSMNLNDLLEFCAKHEIDGVDLTGYYFPGYPVVPPDEFLYDLKRNAFRLGVDISGTGIRNDFTNPDPQKRKEDITLIKNWIVCASKIGAPVIRIFSGVINPKEHSWTTIANWMVEDIKECVAFGKAHGVVVAIQNHNDFLKTADETIHILKNVDSPWFGLILDIGSFRTGDPYPEIAQCIPYAVNWQIKELVYVNNKEERVNLKKLFDLIKSSDYRGYLPIETLGPGDPYQKVPAFLAEVRQNLE